MIVLDEFKKLIPAKTNYSYDKVVRFFGPQDRALLYPYIRVNEYNRVTFLIFDIDKPFVDNGLTPSYLVVTPETQRCHSVFVLDHPIIKEKHPKDWTFMEKVVRMCKQVLEADRAITYQKLLTKNPFHPKWKYVGMSERTYELSELYLAAKEIYNPTNTTTKLPVNFVEDSRNCNIFNILRQKNFETLKEYIEFASELNPKIAAKLGKPPLDSREIFSIAKSVWNYKQRRSVERSNTIK